MIVTELDTRHSSILEIPHIGFDKLSMLLFCQINPGPSRERDAVGAVLRNISHVHQISSVTAVKAFA